MILNKYEPNSMSQNPNTQLPEGIDEKNGRIVQSSKKEPQPTNQVQSDQAQEAPDVFTILYQQFGSNQVQFSEDLTKQAYYLTTAPEVQMQLKECLEVFLADAEKNIQDKTDYENSPQSVPLEYWRTQVSYLLMTPEGRPGTDVPYDNCYHSTREEAQEALDERIAFRNGLNPIYFSDNDFTDPLTYPDGQPPWYRGAGYYTNDPETLASENATQGTLYLQFLEWEIQTLVEDELITEVFGLQTKGFLIEDILGSIRDFTKEQLEAMTNREILEILIEIQGRILTRKIQFEKYKPIEPKFPI